MKIATMVVLKSLIVTVFAPLQYRLVNDTFTIKYRILTGPIVSEVTDSLVACLWNLYYQCLVRSELVDGGVVRRLLHLDEAVGPRCGEEGIVSGSVGRGRVQSLRVVDRVEGCGACGSRRRYCRVVCQILIDP